MKAILTAAVAATCLSFAAGVEAQAQEFKFDLANEYAASSLPGEGDTLFANLVEERSDGRVKITTHFGGSIGFKTQEHLEMVATGAVPLANTPIHFHGGSEPFLEIGSLPFLASTPERAQILYEVSKPWYEKVLRKHNQIPLAVTPWPPSGFWSKDPVKSVADIQGWKLRTYDVNGQLTMKAAGSNPVRMGWADIIPALSTNAIQGVLTSAEGGVTVEFWQYLKNFTEVNYATPLSMIHMNLDAWEALPEDLQIIFLEAGAEVTKSSFAALEKRRQTNYQTMRENGMTVFTDVDPELIQHLEKSSSDAIDRWLERMGPDGQKVLDAFYARIQP